MCEVTPYIPKSDDPHKGVEVCAIEVDQSPSLVHNISNTFHIALEYTERVGIGNHDCRNILIHELIYCLCFDYTLPSRFDRN